MKKRTAKGGSKSAAAKLLALQGGLRSEPDVKDVATQKYARIVATKTLPLSEIYDSELQPSTRTTESALEQLVKDVDAWGGVIVPIDVIRCDNGRGHRRLNGHRRCEVAMQRKDTSILCHIWETNDEAGLYMLLNRIRAMSGPDQLTAIAEGGPEMRKAILSNMTSLLAKRAKNLIAMVGLKAVQNALSESNGRGFGPNIETTIVRIHNLVIPHVHVSLETVGIWVLKHRTKGANLIKLSRDCGETKAKRLAGYVRSDKPFPK